MQMKIVMGSIYDTKRKHIFMKVFGYMSGDTVWIATVGGGKPMSTIKKPIPKNRVMIIACLRNRDNVECENWPYVTIADEDIRPFTTLPELTLREICEKFGKSTTTPRRNYIFVKYKWEDESDFGKCYRG